MKEFNEKAATDEACRRMCQQDFIDGAEWQYEQDKEILSTLSSALAEAELELRRLKGTASGAY
jgi:hypothetical protein